MSMIRKTRLYIGSVDDLFRDDSDSEMNDDEDIFLNLAAEKFERENKKSLFGDKDVHI